MKRLFESIRSSPLTAAAFLMATSAIGPGFLTQTAVFTQQLGASFGFVILVSILIDVGAQVNIWRVVGASGLRVQDMGERVLPGAGRFLTGMVVAGGLAFNIGNLAGAGLGLNVLTGMPVAAGAVLSAGVAVWIFLSRDALSRVDGFAKLLGLVMIGLTLYVAFSSSPPLVAAVKGVMAPDRVDAKAVLTLVGGTVGGYISFAGAHRLLDAGRTGSGAVGAVTRSAVSAILLASVMRVLLFLAALGVVSAGGVLGTENPAAEVFRLASGEVGRKIFGMVMWCAAITSVTGSAYTSVSFLKGWHPWVERRQGWVLTLFVALSAIVFVWVGRPVKTLIVVGALNGLVLPLGLGLVLWAAHRRSIVGDYRQPPWLTVAGMAVVVATLWMAVKAFV
jgi:Mn2+/Fe2+ NRAMP family transporter